MTDEGFEWDPAKDAATLARREFGFAWASRVFADPGHQTAPSARPGEPRHATIGVVDGVVLVVVWTPRGDRRRIISARRASRRERRDHDAGR